MVCGSIIECVIVPTKPPPYPSETTDPLAIVSACASASKQQPRCVWGRRVAQRDEAPISVDPMSFRGRPSLSGTPGRSSLEPSSDSLDLAKLRADLVAARDLTCFQVQQQQREGCVCNKFRVLNTAPTVALWGGVNRTEGGCVCACVCATHVGFANVAGVCVSCVFAIPPQLLNHNG